MLKIIQFYIFYKKAKNPLFDWKNNLSTFYKKIKKILSSKKCKIFFHFIKVLYFSADRIVEFGLDHLLLIKGINYEKLFN